MPLPELLTKKEFTCATLAESANYFIRQGEFAAIKELLYIAKSKGEAPDLIFMERMSWLCRMVFVSRSKEPLRDSMLGACRLPDDSMPLKSWPFFPLCLSGNSFFAMSEGRVLGGRAEPSARYIQYCQSKGKFRKELLFVPTREQTVVDAARLRESAVWKAIRWGSSEYEARVWGFIFRQAKDIPKRVHSLRL